MTAGHARSGRPLGPKSAQAVADLMFALSTPSRVRILSYLRERPHTVGELTEAVGMEQSAVSHQLRVLREYGFVTAERHGRQRVYGLHNEHVASLLTEAVGHLEHLAAPNKSDRAARRRRPDAAEAGHR
jgi:DNA-binding transcriptional ArsR family regulator